MALSIANGLVGNDPRAAGIEITAGGFRAELTADVHFALTGVEMDVRVNGKSVPLWTTFAASRGDILTVGFAGTGLRAYLAISGGIDVPLVMGSRSTYLRGGFGGLQGRALIKGDTVPIGHATASPPPVRIPPPGLIPPYSEHPTLRVVLGPQDDYITAEGVAVFLQEEYTVTARCDRMGILLEGPRITHRCGPDIISDGTLPGAVQVPGNGQPAILGADCQTTGGYAKVATVIAGDLPLLAQIVPGSTVRFEAVTLLQAREIYLKREYQLRSFHASGIHSM
jgi:biotin-dependent carboxylase-like uncharacterized protein